MCCGFPRHLDAGKAILNAAGTDPLLLGLDVGEQDDRYTYSYSLQGVLDAGSSSDWAQFKRWRDYFDFMEHNLGGTLASLLHTPTAAHHYHKTGLYSSTGGETASSAKNVQTLYSFLRGSAKQYGLAVYGQVSVFSMVNGFKTYGFAGSATADCTHGQGGAACGTSLSLMKRLMYTEMSYDSVYFAMEGGWEYGPKAGNLTGTITPIGRLQAGGKRFFSSAASTALGVHTPTIAVLLDYYRGWHRPCDGHPYTLATVGRPRNWGVIPWDEADFAVDHLFETVYPGYRESDLADESSHLAPTPFGDVVDTLLSDVHPDILARYDTVVAPHRIATEPGETRLKLDGYVRGGGTLFITAATVTDLGSELLGVSVAPCVPAAYLGQNLSLCPLSIDIAVAGAGTVVSDQLVIDGQLAAMRLSFTGGGVLRVVGAGRYGLAGELNATRQFNCGTKNQPDPGGAVSPYEPVTFVHEALTDTLAAAALFDLGPELSWVPRRIAAKRYTLMVVNNALTPRQLNITSLIGPIESIAELSMDQSEKQAPIGQGWLPYGFDNTTVRAALGRSTANQIAGLDTRAFLVTLSADRTVELQPAPVGAPPPPRLLRLPASAGPVRTELLKRPSFQNYFDGVVLDWEYLESRSEESLQREARWWRWRKLRVVVDFTSGTTVVPGPLRLIDDWWYDTASGGKGPWHTRGMARLTAVLKKMPLVGARDAILTLHGHGGEGAKLPHDAPDYVELLRQTFAGLAAAAAPLNVTLHLRDTGRNGLLRRTTDGWSPLNLSVQLDFARSIPCPAGAGPCVKVAPNFARNGSLAEVRAAVASGAADMLLLSADGNAGAPGCVFSDGPFDGINCPMRDGPGPGGAQGGGFFNGPSEGAPLATLGPGGRALLRRWAAIDGATLVLDASPAADGAPGRGGELADVRLVGMPA